jgi:hypothetical protein
MLSKLFEKTRLKVRSSDFGTWMVQFAESTYSVTVLIT